MDPERAFRQQAAGCADLGSPMYSDLLDRAADDIVAGGPVAVVLAGHEQVSGPSALGLRFAGSVHRLVLERRAGALAAFYPSVGGRWESSAGWAAFREFVAEQPEAVAEWLDRPPQTNEVGRSAALMAGLLEATRRWPLPVRLFEIGSSAGLNLLCDRFSYEGEDGTYGPSGTSLVHLVDAWRGDVPTVPAEAPWPKIVERRGSDLMPIDVTTTEGRLALTAYVWPDQTARHERLRGALQLAQTVDFTLRQASARDFVDDLGLAEGAVTVLWHSVMWQYLDRDEQDAVRRRIDVLGQDATATRPFVHLALEPTRRTPGSGHEFLLTERVWPGGEYRILAKSRGHGVPTTWEG